MPSGTRIEIQKSARFLLFGNLSIYCYWLLHFLFLYILFQWTSGGKGGKDMSLVYLGNHIQILRAEIAYFLIGIIIMRKCVDY